MQTTVDGILAALDTTYATDSAAAAALGLSRQAYSLIKQRRALSDAVCIRAAAILGLDPAETLIRLQIDRATPETRATYEDILNRLTRTPEATDNGGQNTPEENNPHPTENTADNSLQTFHNQPHNTNYALFDIIHNHEPLHAKKRIANATQLVQWMLCVPRISPASPRFAYYADNWNVLEKIRRFTESGEFASIVKDCPAFSSEELRAALDYIDRSDPANKPRNTTAQTIPFQALTASAR